MTFNINQFKVTFLLILTLGFSFQSGYIFASTQNLSFQDSLKIVNSKLHYSSKNDGYNYVSCIGTIENNSDKSWSEIFFEVQFFNSKKELIDTITDYDYSMVVPAHDKITFRVRGGADREINEYKTHKVRITSAKPISCNYSSKKKKGAFLELFISWTPMLLLIAVWIFFMRKYQGKNSPQKRIIELQKRQCELIEKQNTLFEKLVDAVKMINKNNA